MGQLLPSEGICHGCYVLGYAATLNPRPDFDEWVSRARRQLAGESGTRDIERLARTLLNIGLVSAKPDGTVYFRARFPSCRDGSDRLTRLRIAMAVLQASRPRWLPKSGVIEDIVPALVPERDLLELEWMGSDLEPILASLVSPPSDDAILKTLGDFGEAAVMAAETRRGRDVLQVSEISDHYGYDLESADNKLGDILRLEVKAAVSTRPDVFYLSRNQFRVARVFDSSWRLVQVVFDASDFWTKQVIDRKSIYLLRYIDAATLHSLAVQDLPQCKWQGKLRFKLGAKHWVDYPHRPPTNWSIQAPLPR